MNIMDLKEVKKAIIKSTSKSDVLKLLGYHNNGRNNKRLNEMIKINNINILHFNRGIKNIKYEVIEKKCPVCDTIFKTKKGHKKEKTVCSRGCSNTFFRSGKDNPNYKDISEYDKRSRRFVDKYREICFNNHEHKCVVCGESKMLDVHHFDNNKFNNEPNNLIPICATHHNYLHSKYRDEVIGKVIEYRNTFINNNG
jgi:hypothetical protein